MTDETTKPAIELRKIKHQKSLSEETPAYAAEVWVDGKPFCLVSNHGQGGPDEQVPAGRSQREAPGGWAAFRQSLEALEARIKATYPVEKVDLGDGKTVDLEPDLELICHQLLGDAEIAADLRRSLKTKFLFQKPGQPGIFQVPLKKIPEHQRDQFLALVKEQHKIERTLNEMPFDEALRLYEAA